MCLITSKCSTTRNVATIPVAHPQIRQRKQRHQIGRVLGQAPVLDLDVAKLPLDDPQRMLHLCPDAGFDLL